MIRMGRVLFVFLTVVTALVLVEGAALKSFRIFHQECPNTDVLQPDGNIRLITVIDRMQDLRSGEYLEFVSSYFRGNTWPPLRPTLSHFYFLLRGGPSAADDIMISFFFYLLLFLLLLFVSLHLGDGVLQGAALFFFSSMMLVHTRELAAYSLSAMLETQGMFFLLLALYFLYRLYGETYEGEPVSRHIPIGLFIAIQGLVFTKYPYAAMFFLAIILYEILARPLEWREIVRVMFERHYRGPRRIILALFLLIFFVILLAGKLGFADINIKSFKYFIWLIVLLVFVDLNIFLYRERGQISGIIPAAMKWIYLCGIFPAAIWILLHPDRFSSILGGQFWVPPEGLLLLYKDFFRRTFFDTLFFRVFDSGLPLVFVFVGSLLALILFGVRGLRDQRIPFRERWNDVFRDPLAGLLLLIWIQFLALELFTPNKQDRHIYHMLPALLLISALWLARFFSIVTNNRILRQLPVLLFIIAGLFPLFGSAGFLRADHFYGTGRPVCFTGRDKSLFDPARWVAGVIDGRKKSVVINLMGREKHGLTERRQDSEIDLLLRLRAFQSGGEIRNDSRWLYGDWAGFNSLLLVTPDCGARVVSSTLRRRSRETGNTLQGPLRSLRDPSGRICLEEYGISVNSPSSGADENPVVR